MKNRYITVYSVTRHYGGPEEGGWWYDHYSAIKTVNVPKVYQGTSKRATNKVEQLRLALQYEHADKAWGNRYHSTGGRDIIAHTEQVRKESETKYKPCYC
jgi:hypothetical protein